MEDVVKSGTGTPARLSNMTCAGKTGTTSDSKDLWFVGYTPYYTAGIWTGYDDNQQLSSAYTYHKTMWKKIMEQIVEYEHQENKPFDLPSGVKAYSICSETGLLATRTCPHETAYFTSKDAPTKYCSGHYVKPEEDEEEKETEEPDENETETETDNNQNANNNNNTDSGGTNTDNGADSNTNTGDTNTGGNNNTGTNTGGDAGGGGTATDQTGGGTTN